MHASFGIFDFKLREAHLFCPTDYPPKNGGTEMDFKGRL